MYLAAEIERLESLLLRCEQAAPEIVEEYLVKSLHIARRQGARLFELRTPRRLGECWPIGASAGRQSIC